MTATGVFLRGVTQALARRRTARREKNFGTVKGKGGSATDGNGSLAPVSVDRPTRHLVVQSEEEHGRGKRYPGKRATDLRRMARSRLVSHV